MRWWHDLKAWFLPLPLPGLTFAPNQNPHLEQARERIITGLLRTASVFGLLTLLFTIPPVVQLGAYELLLIYGVFLATIWGLTFYRQLPYRMRGSTLIVMMYLFGLVELLCFGYSEDATLFLFTSVLLATLFFGLKRGLAMLGVSVVTLLGLGMTLTLANYQPLVLELKRLSFPNMLVSCFIFTGAALIVQISINTLIGSLEKTWQNDQQTRAILEQERTLLEQRIAERTSALTAARDLALAVSQEQLYQSNYLEILYDTTLDLLYRRELNDLLQAIINRAANILDAPYSELLLLEGDELVVRAYTDALPFVANDRVRRDQAKLTWQAFDTREPAVLENYTAWSGKRAMFDGVELQAVADFPILVGDQCLGVLAMGRVIPQYTFSPSQVRQGVMFSQLVAVVLDNANLYSTAQNEINKRQQALQTLQQTADELTAQNAELDAFAHTVAHDIKNPITSIVGSSQLLKLSHRTLLPNQIDAELDKLMRLGKNMGAIVDELLLLANTRSNNPIALQSMNMAPIVERLHERLAAQIDEYRATINYPDTWPIALGYAPWVEEIWANYLSNAIKYGGNPPWILLGAEQRTPEYIRFWVRDNGAGLSPEQQARLFTPFTRLHIDQAPGHGLGLSIVQRIAEKLGGQVGVESTPGQGSTFWFELPLAPEASLAPEQPVEVNVPSQPTNGHTQRILLAEDNPLNQIVIAQLLNRLGHNVDVVDNGRSAVEAVRNQQYNCVLLDIHMPELDGIAATKQIRALGSSADQPWIIALTASSRPEEIAQLQSVGVNDHLGKPVSLDQLHEALQRSIKG